MMIAFTTACHELFALCRRKVLFKASMKMKRILILTAIKKTKVKSADI